MMSGRSPPNDTGPAYESFVRTGCNRLRAGEQDQAPARGYKGSQGVARAARGRKVARGRKGLRISGEGASATEDAAGLCAHARARRFAAWSGLRFGGHTPGHVLRRGARAWGWGSNVTE